VTQRLFLLRHSEVPGHRGDVPVTAAGLQLATDVGRRLGERANGAVRVISGETRRTLETAAAVARGALGAGAEVIEDGVAFALRNPDLYLAGVRVNMVSSEAAFAEQIPGFSEADVAKVTFFNDWLTVPDRVGWWVRHPDPPGDDAAAVAVRIRAWLASFADRDDPAELTVAISHSPVLRALAVDATGSDPGEPEWLAGLQAVIDDDRSVRLELLPQAP